MDIIPCKVYHAKMHLVKDSDNVDEDGDNNNNAAAAANIETFVNTNTIATTIIKKHNANDQTGIVNGVFGATMSQTETNKETLPRTQSARISYKSASVLSKNPIETASTANDDINNTVQNITKINSEIVNVETNIVQNNNAIQNQILKFNRQKIQRTQEMQEIHEMLVDLSKSPVKLSARTNEIEIPSCSTSSYHSHKQPDEPISATAVPIVNEVNYVSIQKPNTDRPSYNRSKSDMLYVKPRTAVTYRRGARATNIATTMCERSQSSYALPTTEAAQKQKLYDRADTRRFMEEQRKKRRVNTAFSTEAQKTARDEEIKKRLEELRKNTRKILNKNMQKRKKDVSATSTHKEPTFNNNLTGKLIFRQPTPRTSNAVEAVEKTKEEAKRSVEKNVEIAVDVMPTINQETNIKAPLVENKKRIGLLRKPETNDHSYSAINDIGFNKENVAMDIMTPKFSEALETHIASCKLKQKDDEEKQATATMYSNVQKKDEECINLKVQPVSENSSAHTESDATSARLPKADIAETEDKSYRLRQIKSEMPYWLKPSAVQVYPYNFIWAVRRKLESITNPLQACASAKVKNTATSTAAEVLIENKTLNQTTSTGDLLENIENIHEKASRTKAVEKSSSNGSLAINNQNTAETEAEVEVSQSEQMTNYSSISIQLPESNTVSEMTSLTSEYHRPSKVQLQKQGESIHTVHSVNVLEKEKPQDMMMIDDDTTVSSAILNSVEIASTNFKKIVLVQEDQHQFIAPRVSSPLSLEKVHKLQIVPKNERKKQTATTRANSECTPSIDFDKFLVDFNRSLSQVIEVNEKLKNTIEKSPSSYQSESKNNDKKPNSIKMSDKDEYTTDDFEESSHGRDNFRQPNSQSLQINTGETHTIHMAKNSQKILALKRKLAQAMSERSHKNKSNNCSSSSSGSGNISSRSHHVTQTSSISSRIISTNTEVPQGNSREENNIMISTQPNSNLTCTISTHCQEEKNTAQTITTKTRTTTTTTESIKEELRKEHELSHCENDNAVELKAKRRKSHIKTHINDRRGDYERNEEIPIKNFTATLSQDRAVTAEVEEDEELKDIAIAFKHNELELSYSLSESSFNYSSVGQYEKLIQKETTKSEQLTLLLKMREKALLDRTKGQIAWLELQKERYKSKGLLAQIAAIKKKQRAILLKMEKERDEIKR